MKKQQILDEIAKLVQEYDEFQEVRGEELAKHKNAAGEVVDRDGYRKTRAQQDEFDAENYGIAMARLAGLLAVAK
ncbi:hypothetical protein [Streptomyces asiaticus]|uniref:hypothetical protein n=1 Tax=Streptomyces asiaticus TaxID=114695 RepID=UPI003F66B478